MRPQKYEEKNKYFPVVVDPAVEIIRFDVVNVELKAWIEKKYYQVKNVQQSCIKIMHQEVSRGSAHLTELSLKAAFYVVAKKSSTKLSYFYFFFSLQLLQRD